VSESVCAGGGAGGGQHRPVSVFVNTGLCLCLQEYLFAHGKLQPSRCGPGYAPGQTGGDGGGGGGCRREGGEWKV